MVSGFLNQTLIDYQKLYSEIEAMGAPEEALEIVRKSIDDTKLLINQRESRELESRVLSASVAEAPADESLIVGREYKNFKEACVKNGLIPEDSATPKGNTKKKLEKELATLFEYQKKGQKLMVTKVHHKQLQKQDKRRDKAIYVNPIKVVLFYSLKSFKGELYFSVNKFIELLEIFNKKYCGLQIDSDYQEVALETGIDVHTLKGFKIGSKREAQRIIERALKSMKSQRILDYMQGRIIVTNDNNYRFATPEERRVIQRIEEEELRKLNCFNMASLKYKNLENKFYYRIKERFQEEGLDYINYTFYGYSIVSHDKTITEQIELLEKEANVVELKKLFKKRLKEFAVGSHAREVKKELDSVGFGEPILEFNPIASSSYIPSFQKAIDTFIDI